MSDIRVDTPRRGPERLLPFAAIASAAMLFASELMTTFKLDSGPSAICLAQASDRHHYAQVVLAVFAAVAIVVAIVSGSKPAAIAAAIAGLIALLVFLTVDLPDANNVGTLNDACGPFPQSFFDAKAVPQAGFWLELIGALGLTITGVALATLSSEALAALRPGGPGSGSDRPSDRPQRGRGSGRPGTGTEGEASEASGGAANLFDRTADEPDRPTRGS